MACFLAMALAAALAPAGSAATQEGAQAERRVDSSPLFAIVYRAGPNWIPDVPMSEQGLLEHFYYMRELHERGRLVLAGPLGEDGGLIILRALDQAEADGMIAADPAIVAGKFVGEAKPFVARFDGTAR